MPPLLPAPLRVAVPVDAGVKRGERRSRPRRQRSVRAPCAGRNFALRPGAEPAARGGGPWPLSLVSCPFPRAWRRLGGAAASSAGSPPSHPRGWGRARPRGGVQGVMGLWGNGVWGNGTGLRGGGASCPELSGAAPSGGCSALGKPSPGESTAGEGRPGGGGWRWGGPTLLTPLPQPPSRGGGAAQVSGDFQTAAGCRPAELCRERGGREVCGGGTGPFFHGLSPF